MKTKSRITGFVLILFFVFLNGAPSSHSEASDKNPSPRKETEKTGWIGVIIQDVNKKIARKAKLDSEEGTYVNEIVENSPADSSGIQEGDVIVEFRGEKVVHSDDLIKAVQGTTPGTNVSIQLVRAGEKKIVSCIVGKNKGSKHHMFGAMPHVPDVQAFMRNHFLGLRLLTLNEQLGEYFEAPENEGVLVEEVESKSAAEQAGFKAGDVIVRVGKKKVDAVEKIEREFQKYDEGDKVEIEVLRRGTKKILIVEMEDEQSGWKNFYFRKPHIRIFQTDPFDDESMRLEMDELEPNVDHRPIEHEQAKRNFQDHQLRDSSQI
jgi:membrane-associated protease RseP (regulator of RpoE activity)